MFVFVFDLKRFVHQRSKPHHRSSLESKTVASYRSVYISTALMPPRVPINAADNEIETSTVDNIVDREIYRRGKSKTTRVRH